MVIYTRLQKCCIIMMTFLLVMFLVPSSRTHATEIQSFSNLKSIYTDADQISPWAYDMIKEATNKSIVRGYNGKIHPKDHITRAEFTGLIVTILGIETNIDKVIQFNDVTEKDWFYPVVNAAFKERIISGYSETQFMPNGKINREEMASIIVRALQLKHNQENVTLKDMDHVSNWARPAVETIVSMDLMKGYNDKFQPKDLATREMAIVVVLRAYHFINEKNDSKEKEENKDSGRLAEVKHVIKDTAMFMQKMVPEPIVGSIAGEWTVFSLARSNEKVVNEYYEKYYENVVNEVKRLMPATPGKPEGRLHRAKGTEHSRVILALTAIGRDITDVGGYDLRLALADFDYVITQGINGPIFALIAFDSFNYEIPIVEGVKTQTTRERLIKYILDREIEGGGWALGENPTEADPDITAMAIQGLTPYYHERADVKAAVDRGINWLSSVQHSSGGYRSWGSLNSESIAQVIVALSGLGIDAHTDARFIKNGHSVLDALLSFRAEGGGFYHVKAGEIGNGGAEPGVVDPMATDQAMYALVAYERFQDGKNRLYDMTDRKPVFATHITPYKVIQP